MKQGWSILDDLKDDDRPIQGCVLAIVGPQRLVFQIKAQLKELYDKVYLFIVPDDYGHFPDTMGYTAKNWETLETDMEDPALFPFMQKALDAVLEYNNKRLNSLGKLSYVAIEGFLHAPKFGGDIWAVAGFIRGYSPNPLNLARIVVPGAISLN